MSCEEARQTWIKNMERLTTSESDRKQSSPILREAFMQLKNCGEVRCHDFLLWVGIFFIEGYFSLDECLEAMRKLDSDPKSYYHDPLDNMQVTV